MRLKDTQNRRKLRLTRIMLIIQCAVETDFRANFMRYWPTVSRDNFIRLRIYLEQTNYSPSKINKAKNIISGYNPTTDVLTTRNILVHRSLSGAHAPLLYSVKLTHSSNTTVCLHCPVCKACLMVLR